MIDQNLTRLEGVITGAHGKPVTYDMKWNRMEAVEHVILFVHGFKGFKDWGIWDRVSDYFANEGFLFLKINLSHNGITSVDSDSFGDLEAFGNNNFTIETHDIRLTLEAIKSRKIAIPSELPDLDITIIGHSRGGASAIIAAEEGEDINRVVTWAAIDNIEKQYGKYDPGWESEGVKYIANGRTKQQMPLYYQLYEDIAKNKERFNLERAVSALEKPLLICHGDADPTVNVSSALQLRKYKQDAELFIAEGANHVFGGSHPYSKAHLPEHMRQVADRTLNFIREN